MQGTCLRLSTTDANAATQWIGKLQMNGCEHRELNEEARAQEPLRSMELTAVRTFHALLISSLPMPTGVDKTVRQRLRQRRLNGEHCHQHQ